MPTPALALTLLLLPVNTPPPLDQLAPPAPATAPSASPADTARAAVARLKTTLVRELGQAIAASGAAGAVTTCGAVAARVRDEVQSPTLRVGRTSSRLRNPGNAAPAWVAPILEELERQDPKARGPREVTLKDGTFGYVEPLITGPLCLQCHGPALAPDVKAAVAARYTNDKAVGFVEGALRGVVWVEVKPDLHGPATSAPDNASQ